MSLKVIGFYRRTKNKNPFTTTLIDPIFYILVFRNKKVKEFTLKLSGKYTWYNPIGLEDFDGEAYKNYNIIVNALLGEHKDRIRESWGLSKEEYREIIFQIYFILIKNHSKYGWFKKSFLILVGLLKFYFRRKKA